MQAQEGKKLYTEKKEREKQEQLEAKKQQRAKDAEAKIHTKEAKETKVAAPTIPKHEATKPEVVKKSSVTPVIKVTAPLKEVGTAGHKETLHKEASAKAPKKSETKTTQKERKESAK
jgi:hypothetical protein